MSKTNGMPGPGGSMGQCIYCGRPFVMEIMLGQSITGCSLGWIYGECFMHDECAVEAEKLMNDPIKGDDWPDHAPQDGPVYKTWQEVKRLRDLPRHYVTFGSSHRHEIDGRVFDKDCVAVLPAKDYAEGREKAMAAFGDKFCTSYQDKDWDEEKQLPFFPRGYVEVAQSSKGIG